MLSVTAARGSLNAFLSEINRYPLLSKEEEQRLARRFQTSGDMDAGNTLVISNLRFAVKVAYGFRSYGLNMADLVQEGNIGLMKALQKFDPDKGVRFLTYAVWWIRAYIQNYIVKNWSLVKFGTTQAQRTLFFSLARTKRALEKLGVGMATDEAVAKKLQLKTQEVTETRQRLEGRDLSLDVRMEGDDSGSMSLLDFLEDLNGTSPDKMLEDVRHGRLVQEKVFEALRHLDSRERFIIEQRLMADVPMTLKELGQHFGFSRERARQLEIRAKEKLTFALAGLLEDVIGD